MAVNDKTNTPTVSEIGKEAGLLMFGVATGLLASSSVSPKVKKPLGFILGAVGIAAAGPEISKLITRAVNSPSNSFGSKKTLESIRHGSGKPVENVPNVDEESSEQLFIG